MSCPDLLVLSQLADGELSGAVDTAAAMEAVRFHVAGCAPCRERMARLEGAMSALASALRNSRKASEYGDPNVNEHETNEGCLTPSQLAGWIDPGERSDSRSRSSLHLERCDPCLARALDAAKLTGRLFAPPIAPVPEALKARVASRWELPAAPESMTSLVVRVARSGVRMVERVLVAPIRSVAELAVPAPAMRSAGERDPSSLRFELEATEARIQATVEPVGEAVSLTLVLEGVASGGLSDQRVFLRRHGRSIYSARTDKSGLVRMPDLERGIYEISFPTIATAFRIDLRR